MKTLEKKYTGLGTLSTLLKVLGIIAGIGIMIGIVSSAIIPNAILCIIVAIVGGSICGCIIYGMGELIELFIDIEFNLRHIIATKQTDDNTVSTIIATETDIKPPTRNDSLMGIK